MISVHFQSKAFNVTVIQIYGPILLLRKLKLMFYGDLEDLLELTPKKKMIYSSSEIGMQKRYLE